jgi:choline dehydrogenase-like flavoprotein
VYDYIVVGSGVSGMTAAIKLANAGKKTLVIEQGPLFNSRELPENILESFNKLYYKKGPFLSIGKNPISILAGNCVGGSSVMSGMILHKTSREYYNSLVGIAPNFENSFSFNKITNEQNNILRKFDAKESFNKANYENFNSYFIQNKNYTSMIRPLTGCKHSGLCMLGCPNNAKKTYLTLFENNNNDNLSIISNSKVKKIILNNNKAIGVLVTNHLNNDEILYFKKELIIAGGVLQSGKILHNSSIKLKKINKNITCNIGGAVFAQYPKDRLYFEGPAMGLEAFMKFPDGNTFKIANQFLPRSLELSRIDNLNTIQKSFRSNKYSIWTSTIASTSTGNIYNIPIFGDKLFFNLSKKDLDNIFFSIETMNMELSKNGAIELLPLLKKGNFNIVGVTHLFGGCTLGKSPNDSVVDHNLKIWGYDNIRVIDASVFPLALGINPTLTISSIASIACDIVLENS